jgi:3-hydroxyisobutyrate dehydrogenase-like beta-hydroxyacid dehydrogenase
MQNQKIGILHPGEMGVSIAASAQNSGNTLYWVSNGRSAATRARAEKYALQDAGSLEGLCKQCAAILCVCPPHAAEEVAHQVISCGFTGLYLDANAISPRRVEQIAQEVNASGASFIDGGIIGGPAWKANSTWLYLSGPRADEAAGFFSAGPLATHVLGGAVGKASALKMCFAAYSKGTTALLAAILAAAEALGVHEDLNRQWARGNPGFPDNTAERVRGVTAKAWRFSGEMEEIALTFQNAGLPGGFHKAAAQIYERIAHFKDSPQLPSLEEVLDSLLDE